MKMVSKKRNIKKEASTYEEAFRTIVNMGQRVETMEVNGNIFFPCKICKRLFKKEVEAMEHFRVCKPQYMNKKVIGELNEALADEVDSQRKPINNNYIEDNETKNRKRNTRSFKGNVDESSSTQSVETRNKYISVPKKRSIRNIANNVQVNNFVNGGQSVVHPYNLVKSPAEGNGPPNVCELPAEPKKIVKPTRRGKRLTENEIAERLRIISEKLKKKAEVKVYEDEEEEERREIEDRLTALNKDSELSYFDDYPELDDRLKDGDGTSEPRLKDSIGENMVANSKNLITTNGAINPFAFNGLDHLNSPANSSGPIIITQSPDGQLHGCLSCPEVFISALELLRHKREKHTVPKIKMAPSEIKKFYDAPDKSHCPICKRVLAGSRGSLYIKHLQTHTYVGEFECSICKKKFKRKDHMRMHKKRHITESFLPGMGSVDILLEGKQML